MQEHYKRMFKFLQNIFKKRTEQQLTITINGESYTTEDQKEISEIMRQMGEALKSRKASVDAKNTDGSDSVEDFSALDHN